MWEFSYFLKWKISNVLVKVINGKYKWEVRSRICSVTRFRNSGRYLHYNGRISTQKRKIERNQVFESWVVNDERMFSFLKQGKYMYCLWCGWKNTKEELESKIVNSSGLKVYNFIYLHVRSIHCVNYMLGKTHKEIGNQLNPSMQRGFNENETKLILCSIFSISTFNDLYLFA